MFLIGGCGRSSLFGSDKDCLPGDPRCTANSDGNGVPDGGIDNDSGMIGDADVSLDGQVIIDGGGVVDGEIVNDSGKISDADVPADGHVVHDGGFIHHDGGIHHHDGSIHHDGGFIHHDGSIHYDGGIHHHDGSIHYDGGFIHHDGSIHHHDGSIIHDGSIPPFPDGSIPPFSDGSIPPLPDGGLCPHPVDCSNPYCASDPSCHTPGWEICNNGFDDNENNLIDCADPQCFGSPFCTGQDGGGSWCDPVNPNCADPLCKDDPRCITVACATDIDFGVIAPVGASVMRNFNTKLASRSFKTCAWPGGTAQVGVFLLTQATSIKVDFASQDSMSAHVVEIFRAGTLQACDANPILNGCIRVGEDLTATRSFANLPAGYYYVIVQSYPSTQGPSTVTISTACAGANEICNNGRDDNCNGLVDCADPECFEDSYCSNYECTPDINLGALAVGDAEKLLNLDLTTQGANRYHPTCAGDSTGNDVVVRFTLHETASILVRYSQTGINAFGLFREAASGLSCDSQQLSCFSTVGLGNGGQVAFVSHFPPGQYVFIFKPVSAQDAGILNLAISAYRNQPQEICSNGVDDDGNELIDCQDPACLNVPPCNAPLCLVDQDLGTISWGTAVSTTVDTSNGTTLYPASCATGSGKDKVLRFVVTQPMGLGFYCTQTGSNVLQLAAQIRPLDPCNANNFNCADPATLPFGCNFMMPGIQPGTYNLIVEAFKAGDEGIVDLTLYGIYYSIPVTCDSAITCRDPLCVTAPYCHQFACQPDSRLGMLSPDGNPVAAMAQTTLGKLGANLVSCVSNAGGKYQTVDFEVSVTSDVTVEWAQLGNADIALFATSSTLFACDAEAEISCHKTNGTSGTTNGTFTINDVPRGKYHMIVKADHPGTEGYIILYISSVPAT